MPQSPPSGRAEDIAKDSWQATLDRVTNQHAEDDATIEIVGRDVGDQFDAMQLPFAYIEYDDKDDVVIVAVGGRENRLSVVLRHIINRPTRVALQHEDKSANAVGVVDADGTQTIVTFISRGA